MPLKLVPGRHGSPNYYIRGTFRGFRIDKSTGVRTRREADEILAALQRDLLIESAHGVSATRTFADAAMSYMEADGERTHLPALIRHLGERPLSRIGPGEIKATATKLSKRPGGKRLLPSTVNRQIYTPLIAVLNHAAELGWCYKPKGTRPEQPKGRVRQISYEEADRLIAAAAPHLKPIVKFMLSTGARVGEVLTLQWEDVDLTKKRLVFWDTKNTDNRGVSLNKEAVSVLAALPHRSGAVFRRPDGKPYEDRGGEGGGQLKTAWRTMLKRAGITDFTPHDCRHTWASWTYGNGVNLTELMALGGWRTAKMALRYAHANPDHLQKAAEATWGKKRGVGSRGAAKASQGGA